MHVRSENVQLIFSNVYNNLQLRELHVHLQINVRLVRTNRKNLYMVPKILARISQQLQNDFQT